MQFASDERFQDQHVQSPLQEGGRFAVRMAPIDIL